jgi:environmental stress-induced protein Ves
MQLNFDGQQIPVLPPYGQIHFAGEQNPDCHLIDGTTQDFNAIWKRDALDMHVQRRAMTGSLWCIAEAGVSWFVYFLSGTGRIKDDPDSPEIIAGDAIWLQPSKGQPRLVLEAHGEALWVKIQTR